MNTPTCVLSTKLLQDHQRQFLLHAGFAVVQADFIKIKYLPFQLKNNPNLLLFTSQNAVKSILENKKIQQLKKIPAICVGIKTQQLLLKNGFTVLDYTQYASDLSIVIQQKYSTSHIAFFAGNIRRNTIPNTMQKHNIPYEEYTVYTNEETPIEIKANTQAILFFSPSGVKSYLKKNKIGNQVCFCIGTTTAQALRDITKNVIIANVQTVENTIIQCIKYYKKQ